MSSFTGYLSLAGSLTALYTGLALLLARHRNAIRISGAVLFFSLAAALLLLGLFLDGGLRSLPHLALTQLPLSLCIGPLLLLFVRSAADAAFRPDWRALLHFLPAIGCAALLLPFYNLTAAQKIAALADRAALAAVLPHALLRLVFFVSYAAPLVHILLAARQSRVFFIREPGFTFFHALAVFLSLMAFCICLMLAAVIFPQCLPLKHVAAGGFSLAMVTAFVSLMRTPQFPELLAREARRYGRQKNRLPRNSPAGMAEMVVRQIMGEKLYLREDLKIADVAALTQVRADQLSQLINDTYRINFNRFINRLRVAEIQRRLLAGEQKSILRIAFECGFNTKSAFNTAFKLETGMNPSAFLKQITRETPPSGIQKKRSES